MRETFASDETQPLGLLLEPMSWYLLKTEPSEYSFSDLQKDKKTTWDGVTSPAAVKHMREMKAGAQLIIYETGNQKRTVGTATAVLVDPSDPKNPKLDIEVGKALSTTTTLAEIKANKLFAGSPLVREGRLSVVPLTKSQFDFLTGH
jgi:predicted RNA-binding protein with PUA-like domain